MVRKVMDYVRADVRNPDRLFLFGVILHLEGDPRAREVFESGLRLAGRGGHFQAFLAADQGAAPQPTPIPQGQSPAGSDLSLPPAPAAPLPAPPLPNPPPAVSLGAPQSIVPAAGTTGGLSGPELTVP